MNPAGGTPDPAHYHAAKSIDIGHFAITGGLTLSRVPMQPFPVAPSTGGYVISRFTHPFII
jgi:hypothetical protein